MKGNDKMILEKIEQATNRFNEMYNKYENINNFSDIVIQESIKEALIQRFEYTIETAWKSVKRYLEEYKGIAIENSPKKVLRHAASLNIVDGDNWILFVDLRIKTSHDYSAQKLDDVLKYMPLFYSEINKLLELLKDEY